MERNDLLSRIIPPGISLRAHGYALVIGNLVCLLFSSSFVGKLMSAYEKLYRFSGGKKVLVEGAVMPRFGTLLGEGSLLFFLLSAVLFLLCIYHYTYYFRGSKSIYLMKRLPKRGVILKQVFLFPLCLSGVTLLFCFFVHGVYLAVYFLVTPDGCLPSSLF